MLAALCDRRGARADARFALATPDSLPALTRPADRDRYAGQTFAVTVTVAWPIYNGKTSSCSRVHGYVIYLPWTSAVLIRLSREPRLAWQQFLQERYLPRNPCRVRSPRWTRC